MKNLVLCISFIFFFNFVYSVQSESRVTEVHFHTKSSFNLTCNVSDIDVTTVQWYKDSKKIGDIHELKNRHTLKPGKTENVLTIDSATENDAGNYSCVAYQDSEEKAKSNFTVSASKAIAVKVPTNINVVEEEKLRVECKIVGDPDLYWVFNDTEYTVSSGRVKVENYTDGDNRVIRNGQFSIDRITNEDRGVVTCVGVDVYTGQVARDECMVRIKGKYAALWPFLGICAEVVVLCAIIVIYEKKRNKTELEESDTDQSPDQKNTPDHGKEANLRHRQ